MAGEAAADGTPPETAKGPLEDVDPLPWWSYLAVIALWIAATEIMEAFDVTQQAPYLYLLAALFVAFGALCWMNGRQCGAIHCRISGPAYVLLGAVAVGSALGLVPVGQRPLLWAWFGIFVVAYGIELILEKGGWGASSG